MGTTSHPENNESQIAEYLRNASAMFEQAVKLRPNSVDALRNSAITTSKLARLGFSGEHEQQQLFKRAYELYQLAFTQSDGRNRHELLFDWGNSLFR